MKLPFAINGLGRIGRALLRILRDRPGLELVAINDLGTSEQLAPLIARDSLHGPYPGTVEASGSLLRLDGREVAAYQFGDPAAIPWTATGARIVVDATGKCLDRECARKHLSESVQRVIISGNAPDADATIVLGVNDRDFDPAAHRIVSAASCTTNCVAPILAVLDREFGVEQAMLDTVHSYNNDQPLLEAPHPDPRRSRAAALNMIPTTTSAVRAVERVLPALAGRVAGFAVRVPTPNVSLVDLVVLLRRDATVEDLHEALISAANGPMDGVLGTTDEPLVSSDLLGDPRSSIVDLGLTQVSGRLARVVAWYDNEFGHASRLADLLERMAAVDGADGENG